PPRATRDRVLEPRVRATARARTFRADRGRLVAHASLPLMAPRLSRAAAGRRRLQRRRPTQARRRTRGRPASFSAPRERDREARTLPSPNAVLGRGRY